MTMGEGGEGETRRVKEGSESKKTHSQCWKRACTSRELILNISSPSPYLDLQILKVSSTLPPNYTKRLRPSLQARGYLELARTYDRPLKVQLEMGMSGKKKTQERSHQRKKDFGGQTPKTPKI